MRWQSFRATGIKPQQWLQHLGELFGVEPAENEGLEQVVYRLNPTSYLSYPWKRTVLQQCHGQTIQNIVKTMYLEELNNGAALVDIGVWKSLFDRTVLTAIRELADEGYINLIAGGENLKDTATTALIGDKSGGSERLEERHRNGDVVPSGQELVEIPR